MAKEKKVNDLYVADPCDSTIADRIRAVSDLASQPGSYRSWGETHSEKEGNRNVETVVTKTYPSGDPNVPDEMRVTVRTRGREVQSVGVVVDKR